MNVPLDIAALSDGGLRQHARLLTLASAHDSGLPESLAVEAIHGVEAVNALFCFDVDALSTSADLDLAQFLGEELTIGLLQPDGSRRAWHGICTGAGWLGADGGVARYRLRLEPALCLLALRRDSYIFQDQDARAIVTELLRDYPQVRFDFDLTQALAGRPVCTQYRESDLAFFTRLLASKGLRWRFEHEQAQDAGPDGHGQARHRLVVFDSRAALPPTAGGDVLRFHGVRATARDDTIDAFGARRRLAANAAGSIEGEFDSLADLETSETVKVGPRIAGGEQCVEPGFYFSPSRPGSHRPSRPNMVKRYGNRMPARPSQQNFFHPGARPSPVPTSAPATGPSKPAP